MPPLIAAFVSLIGILILCVLDRDGQRPSWTIGLPLFWILIAGSRNVGEWMQFSAPVESSEAYLEGNPLDRNVLASAVLLGCALLATRRRRVLAILKRNPAVLLYFAYCLLSILWSDFPFVSFKRWIRASGDLVMVLVILTDPDPLAAIKTLLARAGFLLVTLSVLFIRYFPELGRVYSPWDGMTWWTGVTSTKNSLGMVCLVCGIGCMWRILTVWREEKGRKRARHLVPQLALLLMIVYLLWIANSMTSIACFLIAGFVIVTASLPLLQRRTKLIHLLVVGAVCASFSVLFLGASSSALKTMGRDPTLTGRTAVWNLVLGFTDNPLFGAGYESFWMGDRLQSIWAVIGKINQCHNGYLEIYANLGIVGLVAIAMVVAAGYKNVIAALRRSPEFASIRLGYFVVGVIYNFTEAGIKMMTPVWIFFLLAILAPAELASRKAAVSSSHGDRAPVRVPRLVPG